MILGLSTYGLDFGSVLSAYRGIPCLLTTKTLHKMQYLRSYIRQAPQLSIDWLGPRHHRQYSCMLSIHAKNWIA